MTELPVAMFWASPKSDVKCCELEYGYCDVGSKLWPLCKFEDTWVLC